MSALTTLTKLEAINEMLDSIGQAPVNSLEVSGISDVSSALRILDRRTREVLQRGWSFNSEKEYSFAADAFDVVYIPTNVASIDPSDRTSCYVERSYNNTRALYDPEEHTFFIGGPVECDVVWFMEFEDVPQDARDYIAVSAARKFQKAVFGSQILDGYTREDEYRAWVEFRRGETKRRDLNWFTTASQSNIIARRRRNPSRY